jgi:hypothetical protein
MTTSVLNGVRIMEMLILHWVVSCFVTDKCTLLSLKSL